MDFHLSLPRGVGVTSIQEQTRNSFIAPSLFHSTTNSFITQSIQFLFCCHWNPFLYPQLYRVFLEFPFNIPHPSTIFVPYPRHLAWKKKGPYSECKWWPRLTHSCPLGPHKKWNSECYLLRYYVNKYIFCSSALVSCNVLFSLCSLWLCHPPTLL